MPQHFDILLRNGWLVDGTGQPCFKGDLAIQHERIVALGSLGGVRAATEIDVHEQMICPGFIDTHSHDDGIVLTDPAMISKLSQGVTTEIVGNCGISLAPLVLKEAPPEPLNLIGQQVDFHFSTFADYATALRKARPNINIAALIGHATLRVGAMADVSCKADAREINVMRDQLKNCLKEGAIGFSTGLFYAPNRAADIAEVVALAKLLPSHQGIYATHMRDEFDGVMESLQESVMAARLARVPLVISHHKCAGWRNWGRSHETLAFIRESQEKQPIGLDVYPYVAGSTVLDPCHVDGKTRVLITWSAPYPDVAGKDLADIAKLWQCSLIEAARRLMPGGACYFQMDEADVQRILQFPSTMIGSDGLPHDKHPHPRLWGTFPRVLGHYARELKLFSMEEAVRKMTSLAAEQFQLKDRGVLRTCAYADIVVFDPHTVIDKATFDKPKEAAEGIDTVIVNGHISWRHQRDQHARAGRLLHHQ